MFFLGDSKVFLENYPEVCDLVNTDNGYEILEG